MKSTNALKTTVVYTSEGGMPQLPALGVTHVGDYSSSNRRHVHTCQTHRAYPWLLMLSTAVAGVFCFLYLTKPVIIAPPAVSAPEVPSSAVAAAPTVAEDSTPASLLPASDSLPGETESKPIASDPRQVAKADASTFEETNLRVQHVLTAEAPGGQIDRIILDVPVLYQSRNLRWTPAEVAASRDLLGQLMEYQEKCRSLRAEGLGLLDAWNRLVERSIPSAQVRADSPSLPDNQQDAADLPRSKNLQTADAIEFQTSGK